MPKVGVGNDVEIHYEDIGSGPPLLMVHTAAGSGRYYRDNFAPHFQGQYRLLIVDLRGLGQSSRVSGHMPADAWVTDCIKLLDHAGVEQSHLFGSSLGARVVGRMAAEVPERVLSLTVTNPILQNEEAGNARLNAGLGREIPEDSFDGQRHRLAHGDDWREVVQQYFRIRNQDDLQDYLALIPFLDRLTMPTLIIRNDDLTDVTHPLMHAVQWHTAVPSSWLWISPDTPLRMFDHNIADFTIVFERFMTHVHDLRTVHHNGT